MQRRTFPIVSVWCIGGDVSDRRAVDRLTGGTLAMGRNSFDGCNLDRYLHEPFPQRDRIWQLRAIIFSSPSEAGDIAMTARRKLERHLGLVYGVVEYVCRIHALVGDEQDEFRSFVLERLVDDDYAKIRAYRGPGSFSSFLVTVVNNLSYDFRNKQFGKWRPSAGARRVGDHAVLLERLLQRDRRPMEEAINIVCDQFATIPRREIARLAGELYGNPSRTVVDERVLARVPTVETADGPLHEEELGRKRRHLTELLMSAIRELKPADQLLIRLRYFDQMSPKAVAPMLKKRVAWVYRRCDALRQQLLARLTQMGLARHEIRQLFGED